MPSLRRGIVIVIGFERDRLISCPMLFPISLWASAFVCVCLLCLLCILPFFCHWSHLVKARQIFFIWYYLFGLLPVLRKRAASLLMLFLFRCHLSVCLLVFWSLRNLGHWILFNESPGMIAIRLWETWGGVSRISGWGEVEVAISCIINWISGRLGTFCAGKTGLFGGIYWYFIRFFTRPVCSICTVHVQLFLWYFGLVL